MVLSIEAAKLIYMMRKKRNLSQAEVAEKLNVPLRTYQNWEKNYTSGLDNIFRICNFYDIEMSVFIGAISREMPFNDDSGNPSSRKCLNSILSGEKEENIIKAYPEYTSDDLLNIIRDEYFQNTSSRILLYGVVRSQILEEKIAKIMGLPQENIRIADTGNIAIQMLKEMRLGKIGAEWIEEMKASSGRFMLGLSNGYTVARIMDQIPRGHGDKIQLFPINFTMTPADYSISASSIISSFKYRNEGRCLENTPITEEEVYSAMQLADAVLMGIGTFSRHGLYSQMITAARGQSFLNDILAKGAIGDINYFPIGKNKTPISCPSLVAPINSDNHMALIKAIDLNLLRAKADKGCKIIIAAAGGHKAELVKTAVNNGYANHLLIDTSLAQALIDHT